MENNPNNRIGWIDLLRVLACFMVVLSHSCDPYVGQFDNDRTEFLSGAFWGSLMRPCVPLFVMISGVLLLPLRENMVDFYRKRMKRVIVPLIIWSVLLPVFYYLYLNHAVETASPSIDMAGFTLQASMQKLYLFVLNFSYATTALWYLYMLVGLYLFMPVLNGWLANASQQDIRRFLYIWGISLFLPFVQMIAPAVGYEGNYGNPGILGVCDWNPYGTFYYFSGFLGYIVLAYYLVKYPPTWSRGRMLAITVPMFAGGYAITAAGFILTQHYYPADFAYLEILWYFTGFNVFMMTFAVFIWVQRSQAAYSPFMAKVAALTFGVYLCHFILVQMGYDLIHTWVPIPAFLQIPLTAVLAFAVSLGVVWLLSLNRITRRSIM